VADIIWKCALPHGLLFLEQHISHQSHPDYRPTDVNAEMNVCDNK